MRTIKVSVRNLVEFVLMHGDLQPGSIGASRAQEGIEAHQYIQKTSGAEYVSEVTNGCGGGYAEFTEKRFRD